MTTSRVGIRSRTPPRSGVGGHGGHSGGGGAAATATAPRRSTVRKLPPVRYNSAVKQNSTLANSVYVQDDDYCWLPAQIVERGVDGDPELVSVEIRLPSNWTGTTALHPDSSIFDLEEAMASSSTSATTMTSINSGGSNLRGSSGSIGSSSHSSSGGGTVRRVVDLSDFPELEEHEVLPLQNLDASGRLLGKRDMADLPFLHEAAILYNLKERHANLHPYTRVGDILVAMNPFLWIHDNYSPRTRNLYAQSLLWSLEATGKKQKNKKTKGQDTQRQGEDDDDEEEEEDDDEEEENKEDTGVVDTFSSMYDKLGFDPHVYETSSLAYRGLALDQCNQTILVTGESGAGKTETVKIVMTHLATLEQSRPGASGGSSDGGEDDGGNDKDADARSSIDKDRDDAPFDEGDVDHKNHSDALAMISTPSKSNPVGGSDADANRGKVIERVLESNPVFEAFGNAKTLRNDNSSRFGKFTQLQFVVETLNAAQREGRAIPLTELAGSVCVTYLLEKSRVVSHSEGERTYHIFYQLLKGPDDEWKRSIWTGLEGTTVSSFRYVNDHQVMAGDRDEDLWTETLGALGVFRFEGESLRTLLRALCVVLQLGNLVFGEDPASADHEEGGAVVMNREELDKLSELMGVPSEILERCLTKRNLKTGYDQIQVHLMPEKAKESCDALAKEIYARIFDVLVRRMNDYTKAANIGHLEAMATPAKTTKALTTTTPTTTMGSSSSSSSRSVGRSGATSSDGGGGAPTTALAAAVTSGAPTTHMGTISLLDIFGFERFKVNRFEQFCINYANEQLQNKYVLDNFSAVKAEYEEEGIEIFDFSMVDNSKVLALLEDRLGLIISLNEECVRPKGNDESFVYKIKIVNKENDRLVDENLHRKTEFGVRHFAGVVTYDATMFVERNTDKLPEDLLQCATQSTNDLIQAEFRSLADSQKETSASTPGRRKATNRTVLQKFRIQLRDLMERMEGTRTRYIRCIKPNDVMTPRMTDHLSTMRQLECAGLVTAITISRESFPNKLEYAVIRNRFDCLMTAQDRQYMGGVGLKDAVQYMLTNLLYEMVEEGPNGAMTLPFACGNTKTYFRAGALEQLETKRLDHFTRSAVVLQRWVRHLQAEARYVRMRAASVRIQTTARRYIECRRYQRLKRAAVVLQCWVRSRRASALLDYLRQYTAATIVQTKFRAQSKRNQLKRWKRAVVIIQRAFRNKEKRDKMTARLAVAVEEARMDNKLLGLKEQVAAPAAASSATTKAKGEGRTVNEELLHEIESMFDYLRTEIFTLREKNSELHDEMKDAENDRRDLLSHAESAEAAASSSRLRVAQLTKSNATLMSEILEHKHEVSTLRKDLKAKESERDETVSKMTAEYQQTLQERESEIKTLQQNIKECRTTADYEKKLLKDEIGKMEEEHLGEVVRLKDELRRTQDSHHDYLAKLMDVLETTHAAREAETSRISAELNAIKEEKDSQIESLQREVEVLREFSKTDMNAFIESKMKAKVSELTVVQRDLAASTSARTQRGRKFFELADKLSEAVGPENLVAITSARRGRGKKLSVVEEESQRMKKIVRFMSDLYALEESTQAKVDTDMLRVLESYKIATEPNRAMNDLQFQVKQLEAENKRLQEQVRQQESCQRCEARDKRRAERKKGGGGHHNHPSASPASDAVAAARAAAAIVAGSSASPVSASSPGELEPSTTIRRSPTRNVTPLHSETLPVYGHRSGGGRRSLARGTSYRSSRDSDDTEI